MKRFLVFSGYRYEEAGGWNDRLTSASTLAEAKSAAGNVPTALLTLNDHSRVEGPAHDWQEIVDLETEEVVASREKSGDTGRWSEWVE